MQEIPDPIQWHEGMLLMPQHFQQMAGRFECLIQSSMTFGLPYAWGVLRFDYDRSALVSGLLRVVSVRAMMPDGFLVEDGSATGRDLHLDLKSYAEQMRSGSVTVYLVVPAQKSLSTRGELARYLSHDGESVFDEITGEDAIQIPRLRPRVALWVGDVPPARFVSVPLIRIRAKNDVFEESEYFPPCLSVDTQSALGRICSDVVSNVREKSYILASQLRSSGPEEISQTIDLRTKLLCLATGLPPIEASLQSGRLHPHALYLLMCQLAGQVAGATSSFIAPQFPVYTHDELFSTFQPVLNFIRAGAAEAVIESWLPLPFRIVDGVFEAGPSSRIDDILLKEPTSSDAILAIGLRVPPGVPEESVWRWGETCVIGGSSLLPELLSTRVSGAERRRVSQLPGLVPPRGTVLFALRIQEGLVKQGDSVQLVEQYANEGRPSEAILYLRRPDSWERRT